MDREIENSKKVINKDDFYHLVSKYANFTLADVKLIWSTVEIIFEEIIKNDYILDLPGFGRLYVKEVAPKGKLWDNFNKKEMFISKTKRVVFRLSSNLRKLVSNKK